MANSLLVAYNPVRLAFQRRVRKAVALICLNMYNADNRMGCFYFVSQCGRHTNGQVKHSAGILEKGENLVTI